MIGYGISLPIIPFFVQELVTGTMTYEANTTFHVGAVTAIFAFFQMLSAAVWGRISDYTGKRKQVILVGIGGYALSLGLTGVSPSISWLYTARALNGLFSAAVLPISIAYIIDSVPKEWKTKGLAWHGTIVGLGVVTGPAVGSLFSFYVETYPIFFRSISINPFSAVFFLASLLSAVSFLLASIFLPAPKKEFKRDHKIDNLWSLKLFQNDFKVFKPLGIVLFIAFSSQLSLSLFEGTFVLHAQQSMDITPQGLGYIFMVCGLMMAFPQVAFIAKYIDKFGAVKLLPIGLGVMAGGLSFLMLSSSLSVILINVAILALGMAIIIPSVTVLVSLLGKSNSGSFLGLLTGVTSLGQTLGPLLGSLLFVKNIHLPYLLSSILLVTAAGFITVKSGQLSSALKERSPDTL